MNTSSTMIKQEDLGLQISNLLKASLGSLRKNESFDSCIAFGVHKGGSTMLHSFLEVYFDCLGPDRAQASVSLPNLFLSKLGLTISSFDRIEAIPQFILKNPGCCYYGWRNIPASFFGFKARLSRIPAICLIRDPRDCAVSAYFSFLNTHVLPNDLNTQAARDLLLERQMGAGLSIDQWVLDNIARFMDELTRVTAFLHARMKVYRYEDVWASKKFYMSDMVHSLGLPYVQDAFEKAYARIDIVPGCDPRGHVRQGSPGDYLLKLNSSTIDTITAEYRDVLSLFDY